MSDTFQPINRLIVKSLSLLIRHVPSLVQLRPRAGLLWKLVHIFFKNIYLFTYLHIDLFTYLHTYLLTYFIHIYLFFIRKHVYKPDPGVDIPL